MRKIINFNYKWAFTKQALNIPKDFPKNWDFVNLPHTWNNIDGQDGGNDYYRGTCFYAKSFDKNDLPKAEKYYLEIQGANSSADLYLNGKHLYHHDGGYSTWRVNLTDYIKLNNLLVISVDNSKNNKVYPQVADFTFYGGLYRNVNIIAVNNTHFDLDYYGTSGLKITPTIKKSDADILVETFVSNYKENQLVKILIYDANNNLIKENISHDLIQTLKIENVNLWEGKKNPYLYLLKAQIIQDNTVIDEVSSKFGCRTFSIDPENGFILNGKEHPLRGVSRHQDRWGVGNALSKKHHDQDMDLISELGANTIRLAHYQHDQYFYDLCDEKGMIVWAEIPYISHHMPTARQDTINQMHELIIQNYNHPSIIVWGLSNEITIKGHDDPDLIENHKILNDLAHKLDKTRLTTIACVSMCPIDAEYIQIPDVVSYNHYFGWYGGETSMNGPWFDNFHQKYPHIPIGCSEYGCEALNWHTETPEQGDYTEEYQAYYHEELIKQLFTRKYIWATHVWNMFDFGADARAEGGENGQNHKGLITFDRKYKKDAFYAYKAWLSDEPFVHIAGKRYINREHDITKVKVYSNQKTVELFANGVSLGKKESNDHFFSFNVINKGETNLLAIAGDCKDTSFIRKVDKFDENYRLVEKGAILNWFDITVVEGNFSLNDKIKEILKSKKAKELFLELLSKNKKDDAFFTINESTLEMIGSFTLLRFIGLGSTMGITATKEELLELNSKLNTIKK